ncbi:MAG: glycosyltransferase [Lachnospiraceae bacterium]|nr:glycosyltransferase [Lachnospiraceae bacterium]
MNEKTGISMIIATKGRVKLLENLILTIDAERSSYSGPTELIIVDDSNQDEALQVEALCREHDAVYVPFGPSVCAKRNLGGRTASQPVLLFLDSDCLVTPGILDRHEAAYHVDERVGAVCGLLEFTGEGGRFWDCVSRSQFVICFDMAKWGRTVPWGTTANFSVRKDVFEEIDGFDEGFPNKPGGEDVDFGLRIGKHGYAIAAEPKALVFHDKATWTPVKAMYRRVWNYGRADTYVMDRHPDKLISCSPRRTLVFLLAAAFSIVMGLAVSPLCLISIPLWLFTDIVGTSALMVRLAPFNRATLGQQIVIQTLILTNESGFVFDCLKRGRTRYLTKQLAYFENQMKGVIFNSSILAAGIVISVLACLAYNAVIALVL